LGIAAGGDDFPPAEVVRLCETWHSRPKCRRLQHLTKTWSGPLTLWTQAIGFKSGRVRSHDPGGNRCFWLVPKLCLWNSAGRVYVDGERNASGGFAVQKQRWLWERDRVTRTRLLHLPVFSWIYWTTLRNRSVTGLVYLLTRPTSLVSLLQLVQSNESPHSNSLD